MNDEETITFKAGQRIITKDDPAERAYLVVSGKVRVFLEQDDKILDLAELEQGDVFGESALFEKAVYGAHVEALEDTELVIISPGIFQEKLNKADPMLRSMFRVLIERQRATNEALLKAETRELIEITLI